MEQIGHIGRLKEKIGGLKGEDRPIASRGIRGGIVMLGVEKLVRKRSYVKVVGALNIGHQLNDQLEENHSQAGDVYS